jgi:sugar lactone lactonase YvrE
MTRRLTFVCGLALLLLLPAALRAEHTRYWREADYSQFAKGTAHGVAIRSDGTIEPAPKFDSFADPSLAYVWALEMDSHGRLYAAGGPNAKVLRFDASGKSTAVFQSSELAAQAIALDSKDNLYVGTSPDGKIYRVTAEGTKSVFFEPKTKYIWALAIDSHGDLFAGTGDNGKIFVVTPDGKGQLFYQSADSHARSLAFDSKGNLLVGTDPHGFILRIPIVRKSADGIPDAGAPFVVYEMDKQEVTSMVQDADGYIYAAAIGEKSRGPNLAPMLPTAVPQPVVTPTPTGQTTIIVSGATAAQPQTGAVIPAYPMIVPAGGSQVVKIAPDGSPTTVWTSPSDLVFSLAISPSGRLLLGTGDNGSVIELKDQGVYANIAKTASEQVTRVLTGSGGKIYVATANPGKIFAMGPGLQTDGSFASDPFDAKIFSHWGRVTWWGDGADSGKVNFYLRCGNTSNPDKNWSPWSGPYTNPAGEDTKCPASRFAQWKAVFPNAGADSDSTPNISWVSVAYLPKNVAPVIDDIAVQDPGIRVSGFPTQAGGMMPVQLRMPNAQGDSPSAPPMNAEAGEARSSVKPQMPLQGLKDKGYQSVIWSAHDANDDDLIYTVYYRAEGEETWHVLKDKLTENFYSWDTASMPDGAYYLKIRASDSPSNPANDALWAERVSDRWVVANTPPQIQNLRAGSGLLNTRASFDAVSAYGPIANAQYSIDAGPWQTIFPTSQLSDAPKESYYIEIPGLPNGEHTIAVQVTDRFENTAAAQTTFTVHGRGSQ